MSDLAQQVMLNATVRFKQALKRGKRLAAQARAIQDEPEGARHVKDPWNDVHAYRDMRLYLCEGAREALRRLKNDQN